MRSNSPGLVGSLLFALLFFSVGLGIVLVGMDVISVPEENFHAPRWVIVLAGGAFVFSSLIMSIDAVLQSWPGENDILIASRGVIFLLLAMAFLAPFHWVAFGSGERTFTTTLSLPFVSSSGEGSQSVGRLVFGAASILMDVFFLVFGVRALLRWLRGEA